MDEIDGAAAARSWRSVAAHKNLHAVTSASFLPVNTPVSRKVTCRAACRALVCPPTRSCPSGCRHMLRPSVGRTVPHRLNASVPLVADCRYRSVIRYLLSLFIGSFSEAVRCELCGARVPLPGALPLRSIVACRRVLYFTDTSLARPEICLRAGRLMMLIWRAVYSMISGWFF